MDPFWWWYYTLAPYVCAIGSIAAGLGLGAAWIVSDSLLETGSDSPDTASDPVDPTLDRRGFLLVSAPALGTVLGMAIYAVPLRLFGTAQANSVLNMNPSAGLAGILDFFILPFAGVPFGVLVITLSAAVLVLSRARRLARSGELTRADLERLRRMRRRGVISLALVPLWCLLSVLLFVL